MTDTAKNIENAAKKIAAALGLEVSISARETSYVSDKLGQEYRVRVACSDRKATWGAMRKIGAALWKSGEFGRVFADKHSHFETREGVYGGCAGYVSGSRAELRVFPNA